MIQQEKQDISEVYQSSWRKTHESLYHWTHPWFLFSKYRQESIVADFFKAAGITSKLDELRILDVGCGDGSLLRTLAEWRGNTKNLNGIDLLPNRIEQAKKISSEIDFRLVDASKTPFADHSFDIIIASTVLSLVREKQTRIEIAREIWRLLAPNGLVLIYDMRFTDPRNKHTTGISLSEIRELFPTTPWRTKTHCLIPPLARALSKISLPLTAFLEWMLPMLRTHRFYGIRKPLS